MAVPEATVRAMLATVREVALAGDLPATVVGCLHRVIGADYVTYDDIRPEGTTQVGEPPGTPEADEAWTRFGHQHPSLPRGLGDPEPHVVRLSDVASQRHLRTLALWHHVFKPLGIRHQLNVPLYRDGPRLVGLGLSRGGRDFTDGELAVMEMLRAELAEIVALREAARRDPLEAAGLTPREREVLAWLTTGMRDAEIADALGVTRRTVSKHLEAVYRKLGVSSRAAAAAIAAAATESSVLPRS